MRKVGFMSGLLVQILDRAAALDNDPRRVSLSHILSNSAT